MSKNTQLFNLFNILKAAGDKGVSKSEVATQLGIQENSVPVYMFTLKKHFKAEFDTIKNGRVIVAYKLVNSDKITVPQHRKGAAIKKAAKPVKPVKAKAAKVVKKNSNGEVAVPDSDLDITEVSSREYEDIKASLGLL